MYIDSGTDGQLVLSFVTITNLLNKLLINVDYYCQLFDISKSINQIGLPPILRNWNFLTRPKAISIV